MDEAKAIEADSIYEDLCRRLTPFGISVIIEIDDNLSFVISIFVKENSSLIEDRKFIRYFNKIRRRSLFTFINLYKYKN